MSEYSILDPKICGYYRAAVHLISTNQEVTPKSVDENNSFNSTVYLRNPTGANGEISSITDSAFSAEQNLTIGENDILEITFETDLQVTEGDGGPRSSTPKKKSRTFVPMEEGFTQLQILFGEYYECDKLVYQLFKKNINRFKDTNKRWSKLNSGKKTEYYNFFSPSNWQKLSNNEKVKHTKFCNECTITNAYYQALFPSTLIRYTNARKENVVRVLNNIKWQPKKSALKEHTRHYKT